MEFSSQISRDNGLELHELPEMGADFTWGELHRELIEARDLPTQVELVVDSLEKTEWWLLPYVISDVRGRWNGTAPQGFNVVYQMVLSPDATTDDIEVDELLNKRIESVREQYDYAQGYQQMMEMVMLDVRYVESQNAAHSIKYPVNHEPIENAVDAIMNVATYPRFTGRKMAITNSIDFVCCLDPQNLATAMQRTFDEDLMAPEVLNYMAYYQQKIPKYMEYMSYISSGNEQGSNNRLTYEDAVNSVENPWETAKQFGRLSDIVSKLAQCFIYTACSGDSYLWGVSWENEVLREHFAAAAWYYLKNLANQVESDVSSEL